MGYGPGKTVQNMKDNLKVACLMEKAPINLPKEKFSVEYGRQVVSNKKNGK